MKKIQIDEKTFFHQELKKIYETKFGDKVCLDFRSRRLKSGAGEVRTRLTRKGFYRCNPRRHSPKLKNCKAAWAALF